MNSFDFTQPQRQSTKGLILVFLQQSGKMIKSWWPALAYMLIKVGGENKWQIIGLILGGLALLSLIHSILFFRSFRFYFDSNQFILNKGYINRKTLTIPLERIQNVETNQSVLQKMLNVMGLEIDTAGTSKKELKILALDGQQAVALARQLTDHIKSHAPNNENQEDEIQEPETEIVRLSNLDLLKIGLSQNHFKAALLLLAFGNQIFEQAKDLFSDKAEELSTGVGDYLSESQWFLIVIMIFAFLFISFLFSMIRTLVLFYDLRFYRTSNTYRIVSGLLNRKNTLVPFDKIQQLNWETGPLKKLFGIYQLNIRQASSDMNTRARSIELPGCLDKHLGIIREDLFGELSPDDQTKIPVHPRYFIRNWMIFGWIPAILATPLYIFHWYYIAVGLVWLIAMALISKMKQRKTYFHINNDQIKCSSGSIAHKMKQMTFHKVQSIEIQQSIFLKRRGLTNIKIGNSSGFILIPFVDINLAKNLQDYLLYYAETSNESWM